MDVRDNNNRQLFIGIGIGAAFVLIVLVILSATSGRSAGGDDSGSTREPTADLNLGTTQIADGGTATSIVTPTETSVEENGITATFTPTPMAEPGTGTPTTGSSTEEPDAPTPTFTLTPSPEPACDPNNIDSDDPGCVTSDRDLVELSRDGRSWALLPFKPEFLVQQNNIHIIDGKAIIDFFGGRLFIEKGSDIQIGDSSGVSGVIFFLLNRGSLVGEFEGGSEPPLEFILLNGAKIRITGTQFFIDVKSRKDDEGNVDPAEKMFETLNGRTVVGNLDGNVEIIPRPGSDEAPFKLEPGTMTFLDESGEPERRTDGQILTVPFPRITLVELDELNQGSYLISLEDVGVRNGPSDEYDIIGVLTQGRFVKILGRDRANDWFEVACEDMDKIEESKQCWIESNSDQIYPVNTDFELSIVPPLYPPPTPVPTAIPLAIPNLIFPQGGDILLRNPQNESKLCTGTVDLEWEAVDQATHYEVNVLHLVKTGGSDSYSWGRFTSAFVTTNEKTGSFPLKLDQCEMICWQVQAYAGERASGFSSYNNFYFEIDATTGTSLAEVGAISFELYACPRVFREIDVIRNPDLINPVVPIIGTPVFTLPGD